MKKIFLLIPVFFVLAVFGLKAQNVYFVENSNDSGAGSLRQVIEDASEGDTIRFLPEVGSVNLSTGELYINKSLSIVADSNLTITRVGDEKFRIIYFAGLRLYLKNITISNGYLKYDENVKYGGGIYAEQNSSRVYLVNCTISNNTAREGTSSSYRGGAGGGIYAHYLNLVNCRILGNSSGDGFDNPTGPPTMHGAGGNGGGVYCDSLVMINCLVYNNKTGEGGGSSAISSDGGDGGGICFVYLGNIINSTIVNNVTGKGGEGPSIWGWPGKGGGIYNYYYAEAYLVNTIVSDNFADTFGYYGSSDLYGSYYGDYNLIKDTANYTLVGDNNIIGISPGFSDPPDDFTPLINSPVVNAGTPDTTGLFLPQIDLAGNFRISGDTIDIGAYEYQFITGTNSFKNAELINIFPNPNGGTFWIKSDKPGKKFVELFNSSGEIIKKVVMQANSVFIDISNFPDGIYFVRLRSGYEVFSQKVLINR